MESLSAKVLFIIETLMILTSLILMKKQSFKLGRFSKNMIVIDWYQFLGMGESHIFQKSELFLTCFH